MSQIYQRDAVGSDNQGIAPGVLLSLPIQNVSQM